MYTVLQDSANQSSYRDSRIGSGVGSPKKIFDDGSNKNITGGQVGQPSRIQSFNSNGMLEPQSPIAYPGSGSLQKGSARKRINIFGDDDEKDVTSQRMIMGLIDKPLNNSKPFTSPNQERAINFGTEKTSEQRTGKEVCYFRSRIYSSK